MEAKNIEKEFLEKILNVMRKDLQISQSEDFIKELFDNRTEEIHSKITESVEYQKINNKLKNINSDLTEKTNGNKELIKLVDDRDSLSYEMNYMCEMNMYKFGIYDALALILNGTKSVIIKGPTE